MREHKLWFNEYCGVRIEFDKEAFVRVTDKALIIEDEEKSAMFVHIWGEYQVFESENATMTPFTSGDE